MPRQLGPGGTQLGMSLWVTPDTKWVGGTRMPVTPALASERARKQFGPPFMYLHASTVYSTQVGSFVAFV